MLHYLTHPSCGLIAVCSILLVATLGAPLLCKFTRFAQRPDLGFEEGHRLIFEGVQVERQGTLDDAAFYQMFEAGPHQCVCDVERSEIVALENNAVSLKCAVARCGRTMVVGKDLASRYFVNPMEGYDPA